MKNNPKLRGALGLAMRAGKIKFGFDTVKESVTNGLAEFVLIATDLSEKSEKEIRFVCSKYNVSVIKTGYDMEDFKTAIGKKTGIVSVVDSGFAKMILKVTDNGEE